MIKVGVKKMNRLKKAECKIRAVKNYLNLSSAETARIEHMLTMSIKNFCVGKVGGRFNPNDYPDIVVRKRKKKTLSSKI